MRPAWGAFCPGDCLDAVNACGGILLRGQTQCVDKGRYVSVEAVPLLKGTWAQGGGGGEQVQAPRGLTGISSPCGYTRDHFTFLCFGGEIENEVGLNIVVGDIE